MTAATKAIAFLQRLEVPEGPRAGKRLKLAAFQKQFVRGALRADVNTAALSIARGNGKTGLVAGLALAELLGELNPQPRREIIIAARTRDQAAVAMQFVGGFARSLEPEIQKQLTFRRSPRLECEFEGDGGGHVIRAVASDGKAILGTAPTLVIEDERASWRDDRGDELEHALVTGLGKRGGRLIAISTSAPTDNHPFSVMLDSPGPGAYAQEHRPPGPPGSLPADDLESLLLANPGSRSGIGASPEWLLASARRAISRGGSALTSFRNLVRNERICGEARDLLLTVDQWLGCEASELPERVGPVVVGIDLGGSASMSAAAFYWPATGRLEARGWFPSRPSLLDRGQADGVGGRYVEMNNRGELATLGDQTVPVAPWLAEVMRHVEGETVSAIVADRYKASEISEAIAAAGIRAPVVWRGQGFRDGSEDIERCRRACFDGNVRCAPSLLLRSAFADAVCLRDPANNVKLAKARSTGRIDAAAAAVLAVGEGARQSGRTRKARAAVWA